ncbi:MAG: diguanylate cyclase [Oscillospiraceae bacterium]|nr:diguanylate cyclase [Oscillospiraceae bacterium]
MDKAPKKEKAGRSAASFGKNAETFLRALPGGAAVFYLRDGALARVYASDSARALFGPQTAQPGPFVLEGIVHPDDEARMRRAQQELLELLPLDFEEEFRIARADGTIRWVAAAGRRFSSPDGDGYVFTFTDTTDNRQLIDRMRANARVLRAVAEHSERIVYYYDLPARSMRALDAALCAENGLPPECENPPSCFLQEGVVLGESADGFAALFADIAAGEPAGGMRLHVRCIDGAARWFDLRYTCVRSENGRTAAAVLSLLNITGRHEQELSYARYLETIGAHRASHAVYIETDLTADMVEKSGGDYLLLKKPLADMRHSEAIRQLCGAYLSPDDCARALECYAGAHLLALFAEGKRSISDDWRIVFVQKEPRWVRIDIQLVRDPYTDHVRAFALMRDITREKESQLAIQRSAEQDGMTGLYNRATAERLIAAALAADGRRGSILLLLDLDNLKRINDTLGHAQGDRALRGIADTLRRHFRSDDIAARIGGDEFIVFLRGAESEAALRASISSLIRSLARLRAGENDGTYIHCSAGCALSTSPSDTFDTLYKKADVALYHVKRNGKNDYAFYRPEMELADYQFKGNADISLRCNEMFDPRELQRLLDMLSRFYPLVLSANLTKNSYYLMESKDYGLRLPDSGTMDELQETQYRLLHPDDRAEYARTSSRAHLLDCWAAGTASLHFFFRQLDAAGVYRWIERIILLYRNDLGDICEFSLSRPSKEKENDLELLRLHKILELAVAASFEYICLVDPAAGTYELYGSDGRNTHTVPQRGRFDAAVREISERHVAPAQRAAYGAAADLENILRHMRADDRYGYRYTLEDGTREVQFHWYEPTRSSLLMTVRRVGPDGT